MLLDFRSRADWRDQTGFQLTIQALDLVSDVVRVSYRAESVCTQVLELVGLDTSEEEISFTRVCLFGFLTSSSTTRLYRGRAPRQERLTILRFYVLPLMRQSWETMTYVSAGHIIQTVHTCALDK